MREKYEAGRAAGDRNVYDPPTSSEDEEDPPDPDQIEAEQAIKKKWRWLPDVNRMPDVACHWENGWKRVTAFVIPLPGGD